MFGWASLFLGALGLFAVLCLHWPSLLTTPELRAVYPMELVRAAIATGLTASIALGGLSLLARAGRRQGLAGLALAFLALQLGGAEVEVESPVPPSHHLGLDWFVLDLLLLALVFVPLERAFARDPAQPTLRPGWRTDLAHFFSSHLLVEVSALLTLAPALWLFRHLSVPALQAAVAALPAPIQFVACVVLADLFGSLAHRAFHAVPALWRFHAVHHSSESMDWLAGSRLHLVDAVGTRAVAMLPLVMLGFARGPLVAYLVWVAFQATLVHANLRFGFGPLRHLLVTPQYHHWHHAATLEGRDRNFAVSLPWIDRLFGTHHLPGDRWPERYGIDDAPMPAGWLAQLVFPFRRAGRPAGGGSDRNESA